MELGKPLLLLMENDSRKPSYAGGSVESATAGWPQDLKTYFWSGRFVAWGGQPYEWSLGDQDAKLETVLQRCEEMGAAVPSGGVQWADAVRTLGRTRSECAPEPGHGAHGGGSGTQGQRTPRAEREDASYRAGPHVPPEPMSRSPDARKYRTLMIPSGSPTGCAGQKGSLMKESECVQEMESSGAWIECVVKVCTTQDRVWNVINDQTCDILHLYGHGDGDSLLYGSEALDPLFAQRIITQLKPQCVILNACYSITLGDALRREAVKEGVRVRPCVMT